MTDTTIPTKAASMKGRPKAATVKSHWISFRVTQEEHYQLLDKARRSNMVAGEYARSRALRGIARAKKQPASMQDVFGESTRDLYHELRKQGVLLNQIAKHCNTYQVPPSVEFVALADTITSLWRKLTP